MDKTRTTSKKPRVSVDRSIERLRKQLTDFAPFWARASPRAAWKSSTWKLSA